MLSPSCTRLLLAASLLCAGTTHSQEQATTALPPGKVKVYILMGQSNMVGFGRVADGDKPGTLENLVKQEGKYPFLIDDDGNWIERSDAWCVKTTVGQTQGALAPRYGARAHFIGPELGFGHAVAEFHDEPVLIIKASQGNRSLGWDCLPPGSERFEHDGWTYAGYGDDCPRWKEGEEKKPVNWYAGKQYDDFVRDTHEVLDDLPKFFPGYQRDDYEIAGFGWWQGHKDQNPAHAGRYEQNLVALINSLRAEFEAPEAPFVIATIAFGGDKISGPGLDIVNAQLAVSGERGNYPEFADNVRTVDVREFWREKDQSPNQRQDYHYWHNAETYMEVGLTMGRAMVGLQD